MKKQTTALLAAIMICTSLVGCSDTNSSSIANSSTTNSKTDSGTSESSDVKIESSTAESSEASSQETESKTELSGKVVVYMPSPAGLNEKYIADFQEKTGVEVELFQGTTGEILARLETEKDNPVADVVVLASWSDGLAMKKTGQLMSYTPKNSDKLYDGWMDSDCQLFGTSASAVGVIYNTTIISDLSADWNELADEKYKDQIAIPDPEKSGACKDFLAGYMYAYGDEGWKTWENLASMGMTVPGANKAALEAVVTGEKGILIAGVDYNAYSSIKKGEPLQIYYPKSGTVINPRPAMILNTSKNVDNAKAFVDYLLSDDAQNLVVNAFLLPGRSDITCDNRTNVSDIPTFDIDWDKMSEISDETAANLNKLCK